LMTPAAGNPDRIESLGEKMKKRQNTSYAVMAQRIEAQDSLDDFPTPPWATRALIEHVLGGKKRVKSQEVCLEPACGFGHMAKVLSQGCGYPPLRLWKCP
jgi:hypothetical protein